jgi:hypothetical protein
MDFDRQFLDGGEVTGDEVSTNVLGVTLRINWWGLLGRYGTAASLSPAMAAVAARRGHAGDERPIEFKIMAWTHPVAFHDEAARAG